MLPSYISTHIEEDREHWWFRGRLAVLLAVLRRTLPAPPLRLLELGCGTGNVLAALREFGEAVGMEPGPELREAGRAAGLDIREGALPSDLVVEPGWADVVLMLDVLEHLDDEAGALRAARTALRPGGHLVITVPAYQWLWSAHDEALSHRRRYTAARLRAQVARAGFDVERLSYFNTLLFPPLAAVRLLQRLRRGAPGQGAVTHDLHRPPAPVNRALEAVFASERHLVPRLDLPFGSSLVLIARR